MNATRPAVELEPDTRTLCEQLAGRLEAHVGQWELRLRLENGSLRWVERYEVRIGASSLSRFDRVEPP